ncbi:MAG: protein-L-isoaspartate(D-aspartate) O-methyltransferase [Alphaproteobacteria bacterium]|nr:protein-L-isoaspartate(D-aspartate) O-methyltransferase [Alphaproteobacteria bacterium]
MTSETADKLIYRLRQLGVASEQVLAAIAAVPRDQFVPPPLSRRAYDNVPLPIGLDQTISQPQIVAMMTELLNLDKGEPRRVLEIGTGSGYQAAILAQFVPRVYTIERHKALHETAVARFAALGLAERITAKLGDGTLGWPEYAPFDRIIITAAAAVTVPDTILLQCAMGGIIVAPIERAGGNDQYLVRLTRQSPGHLRGDQPAPQPAKGAKSGFVIASKDWTHLGFPILAQAVGGNVSMGKNSVATADFIAEEICPVRFVPLVGAHTMPNSETLAAALKRLNR